MEKVVQQKYFRNNYELEIYQIIGKFENRSKLLHIYLSSKAKIV